MAAKKNAKRQAPEPETVVVDGKPPPHDLDAEAAVLSSILLVPKGTDGMNEGGFSAVSDLLEGQMFYSEAHRQIYQAAAALDESDTVIDVVTVGGWLKDNDRLAQVGGYAYLTEILDAAPVVWNVRQYAQRVVDKYRARQLIALCQSVAAYGYLEHGPSAEYVEESLARITTLGDEGSTVHRSTAMRDIVQSVYNTLSANWKEGKKPGLSTGYASVDNIMGGIYGSDLTVVAGRPGMGKSQYTTQMTRNVAGRKVDDDWKLGAAVFSLEMPREQVILRMLSSESRVDMQSLRNVTMSERAWGPLTEAAQRLAALPIEVDDTPALHVSALRARVRRIKAAYARKKIRLVVVVVDYIQLMRGSGEKDRMNREQEIGAITRALKALAKSEDLSVIALSQLNRSVDTRGGDKRPMIADLRESGSIEQDADNIVFLFRPEYYGEELPPEEKGKTEAIVAKQRNGPTGTALLRFTPWCVHFDDFPEQEVHEPEPQGEFFDDLLE